MQCMLLHVARILRYFVGFFVSLVVLLQTLFSLRFSFEGFLYLVESSGRQRLGSASSGTLAHGPRSSPKAQPKRSDRFCMVLVGFMRVSMFC